MVNGSNPQEADLPSLDQLAVALQQLERETVATNPASPPPIVDVPSIGSPPTLQVPMAPPVHLELRHCPKGAPLRRDPRRHEHSSQEIPKPSSRRALTPHPPLVPPPRRPPVEQPPAKRRMCVKSSTPATSSGSSQPPTLPPPPPPPRQSPAVTMDSDSCDDTLGETTTNYGGGRSTEKWRPRKKGEEGGRFGERGGKKKKWYKAKAEAAKQGPDALKEFFRLHGHEQQKWSKKGKP